jgi:hypothetical protein
MAASNADEQESRDHTVKAASCKDRNYFSEAVSSAETAIKEAKI